MYGTVTKAYVAPISSQLFMQTFKTSAEPSKPSTDQAGPLPFRKSQLLKCSGTALIQAPRVAGQLLGRGVGGLSVLGNIAKAFRKGMWK